jgi:hypothetical protein
MNFFDIIFVILALAVGIYLGYVLLTVFLQVAMFVLEAVCEGIAIAAAQIWEWRSKK